MKNKAIIKVQGGLGNQLFQYLYFLKIRLLHPDIFFDLSSFHSNTERKFYLNDLIKEHLKIASSPTRTTLEKFSYKLKRKYHKYKFNSNDFIYQFNTDEITYYDGYWQQIKYQKSLYKKIWSMFNFDSTISKINKNLLDVVINSFNSISLHLRFGDYLVKKNSKIYINLNMDYYLQAIFFAKSILKNINIFIFSDDIDRAKFVFHKYDFLKKDIMFINSGSTLTDFYLMSICKHHIISNSTFSFFSSTSNKNSDNLIICPKRWYKNNGSIPTHPFSSILL